MPIGQWIKENPKTSAAIGIGALVGLFFAAKKYKAIRDERDERNAERAKKVVVEGVVEGGKALMAESLKQLPTTMAAVAAAVPQVPPPADNSAELAAAKAEIAKLKAHTPKKSTKKHGRR